MSDDTRQRIVTATNELFRRRGYHGTSLSAIGQVADATTGSIYHFFPGGKAELAEAVLVESGAAYRRLFELMAAESCADPARAVADFFAGAAETLAEGDFLDICPIGTVAREVASEHERLRNAADSVFVDWVDAIADLIAGGPPAAAGRDHRPEVRAVATTVVALLEGSFILARTRRDAEVLVLAGEHAAALVGGATASVTRR